MAYEMVKLTGTETKEQLQNMIDDTKQSIATLHNYIETRNDYLYNLEKSLAYLNLQESEIDNLL